VDLHEQRRATDLVDTAGGRAANDSLHDARAYSRKVRNSFHGKKVSAPLHRRACTSACAFLTESMNAFRQVL